MGRSLNAPPSARDVANRIYETAPQMAAALTISIEVEFSPYKTRFGEPAQLSAVFIDLTADSLIKNMDSTRGSNFEGQVRDEYRKLSQILPLIEATRIDAPSMGLSEDEALAEGILIEMNETFKAEAVPYLARILKAFREAAEGAGRGATRS